jgi:hypothetical protein
MKVHKSMCFAAAVALAGCAADLTAPATVKVAVATPCDADVPPLPVFPADTLTGDEDIFTLGKTLWADRKARQAYELKVRTALEGCTAKGVTP